MRNKKIKLQFLDDNLQVKLSCIDMDFREYQNGYHQQTHCFTVDELVRLILDHLGLEPRNMPEKNILQKKK